MKNSIAFLWTAAIDLTIDAVLGTFWFVLGTVLISVGVALLPAFGVGLVVLVAAGGVMRASAVVERRRAAALYDVAIAAPSRRVTTRTDWFRPFAQGLLDLADSVTWRTLLHHFLSMLLGTAFLGLVVLAGNVIVAIGGAALPTVPLAGGVIALALLACYAAVFGRVDRTMSLSLLGPSATDELRERVDTLADARQGAVDAAATERQRIERDLHDGVQPRLVSVAMTLGMARAKFDDDPAGARELLEQAHTEAKASITELRQLARGIHPAVLADRGLDAALSAVASRCPVPTIVTVDLPDRPPAEVEAVIYFTVAEALTNVAKHSGATACSATVNRAGDRLTATIRDNGVGGAVIGDGIGQGGLAGLRDRVRSAGGALAIDSPAGGPTTITVEVPCAS